MINTYDNLETEKVEIAKFVELVNKSDVQLEESLLISVTKYILFFKQVQQCKNQGHYGKCFIYDLLLMVHSLTKTMNRDFYINYRSMIENYVRFVLELSDTDDTGVRNLFKVLRTKFVNKDSGKLIDYIDGEYGKCCDFVHSNIKAKSSIYEYYIDIVNHDSMTKKETHAMLIAMVTFFQNATCLLLINKVSWIDESFYKEKQKLKYLISNTLYSQYEKECEL